MLDALARRIQRRRDRRTFREYGHVVNRFELERDGARTRITITAYWHPRGIWGLAYWYALVPAHLFPQSLDHRLAVRDLSHANLLVRNPNDQLVIR